MKELDKEFQLLYDQLPEEDKKILDEANIKSFVDMFRTYVERDFVFDGFAKLAKKKESERDCFADESSFVEADEGEEITFFVGDNPVEYHLRMKLNNSPIPIWREVKVPSNISLEFLAYVINDAMGWQGYHMHQFVIDGTFYESTESLKQDENFILPFSPTIKKFDSNTFALSDIFKEKGKRIKYEYDFGDGWEHDVWLKGMRTYEEGEALTLKVVKGVGMDPLEDCGGIRGLADIINIISKKRRTADEKAKLEWFGIGKGFDINYFDREIVQDCLDDLWDIALYKSKK